MLSMWQLYILLSEIWLKSSPCFRNTCFSLEISFIFWNPNPNFCISDCLWKNHTFSIFSHPSDGWYNHLIITILSCWYSTIVDLLMRFLGKFLPIRLQIRHLPTLLGIFQGIKNIIKNADVVKCKNVVE